MVRRAATDESGLATSSSDFPSAATPRKTSTTPPMTMTAGADEVADEQLGVVLAVADQQPVEPGAEGAEALGDGEEHGDGLGPHLDAGRSR